MSGSRLGGDRHDPGPGCPCATSAGRVARATQRPRSTSGLDLPLCVSPPSLAGPAFTYNHGDTVTDDDCGTGSSSISGVAFRTTAGNYPAKYDNGLFFADYTRRCIWFAPASSGDREPGLHSIEQFANLRRSGDTSGGAVWVGTTPAGDIIYADYDRQEIRARSATTRPAPPIAPFVATPTSGPAPLDVDVDASASDRPQWRRDRPTHWDLDGDGRTTRTGVSATHTFTTVGDSAVRLKVTAGGHIDTTSRVIHVGNTPPVPTITSPSASLTWAVGDALHFQRDRHRPPGRDAWLRRKFTWTLAIEHCPSNCHEHIVETRTGVKTWHVQRPHHDYPLVPPDLPAGSPIAAA